MAPAAWDEARVSAEQSSHEKVGEELETETIDMSPSVEENSSNETEAKPQAGSWTKRVPNQNEKKAQRKRRTMWSRKEAE